MIEPGVYKVTCLGLAKLNGYKVHCWLFPRLDMKTAVDRRMNNPHDCPARRVWEEVWSQKDSQY